MSPTKNLSPLLLASKHFLKLSKLVSSIFSLYFLWLEVCICCQWWIQGLFEGLQTLHLQVAPSAPPLTFPSLLRPLPLTPPPKKSHCAHQCSSFITSTVQQCSQSLKASVRSQLSCHFASVVFLQNFCSLFWWYDHFPDRSLFRQLPWVPQHPLLLLNMVPTG